MVLLEFGRDIIRYLKDIHESFVPINYENKQQDQDQEFRNIINLTLRTPLKIQYYLWLWQIYSLYAVLKMFLLIPLELFVGIVNSLLSILHIGLSKYITFFSMMTLIVSYIFQQEQFAIFNPSIMYHLFRGQSTLKLYGLIFAIEVAQKILTKTGKYLYTQIRKRLEIPTVEVIFIIPEIIVCFMYTILHTYVIFLQFNIYIVFINASMQNFIIFFFVTNLTKMKGNMFKKVDEKGYLAQINLDAKNRLQKIVYIIIFQASQYSRDIPDADIKMLFVFLVGPIIEHIQHIAILIQSKQLDRVDYYRNKMFYKMYVHHGKHTFFKCLQNQFTVIPFTAFIIKQAEVIIAANFQMNNKIIVKSYFYLITLLLFMKLGMIAIRKINLYLWPLSQLEEKQLEQSESAAQKNSQSKIKQEDKQKKQ